MRLSEALALEWRETDQAPYLDFDRERIIFPAESVKATENQWVPLDRELRAALLALLRQGRRVFHFLATDGKGERGVRDVTVSARVAKLAQAAGVRLTYKALRAGYGCRYAGRVPAQVLQKLMRHSNIKVTMDFYANVDEAVMAAVLGPQRNSSCNSGPEGSANRPRAGDATPWEESECG